MGIKDADALHTIYEQCKKFCLEFDLPYHFTVDNGDYETAIQFHFDESWYILHPPVAKNWDSNPTIICPDLLDFEHKKIIEYEEEGGKHRSGARLAQKGHAREGDLDTTRDVRRTKYYTCGNFDVLRFYETDLKKQNWTKLRQFLLNK